MVNKVVAKKKDGTLLKGMTRDFLPKKDSFHVETKSMLKTHVKKVHVHDLKAIFFVRRLDGDKAEHDRTKSSQKPRRKLGGKHVSILFRDGEIIEGFTHSLHLDASGFFITPADIMDNNQRIFVVLSFVEKIVVDGETFNLSAASGKKKQCTVCRNNMEHNWKFCPFDGTKLK